MKLQGIIDVMWAEDPSLDVAGKILLSDYHDWVLNAQGPWNECCDDHSHGEFTDSEEVVNGVTIHTTTLTFKRMPDATGSLPIGNVRSAWKFKDRGGAWRMLGNGESPFPVAVMNTDNQSGNVENCTVTVTWKSSTGPLFVQ